MSSGDAKGVDDGETPHRRIVVWDAATRLFHWLVALLVLAAYVTYRLNWIFMHVLAGEAVLALVLFRILWGFLGSETTRFASFMAPPGVALAYLAGIFRRQSPPRVGHNPAGGWMIVLLLALLVGETLTGILDNNDVASVGPLSAALSEPGMNVVTTLHRVLWDALVVAIAIHLVAVLFYAVVLRQDLLLPMITGRVARHLASRTLSTSGALPVNFPDTINASAP